MSARCNQILVCTAIVVLSLLSAGCTTITIGDAVYDNGTVSLTVTNAGGPSEGYVQATVYEIRNGQQEEIDVFYAPLALHQGETVALIPGALKPGQYKLYFYLIQNGERKAAAIRDIAVS